MNDFETITSDGPLAGLDDDAIHRVKSELYPGEPVLWAARPIPRNDSHRGRRRGAITTGLMAIVAYVASSQSSAADDTGILQGVALVGSAAALSRAASWLTQCQQIRDSARILYALTDRRAIFRSPHYSHTAVQVHSILRGRVS